MTSSGTKQASASSSDEEPDYMSEDFLKQCTQTDIRPGLIFNRELKRKHDIMTKNNELNKTKAEREKERIKSMEEALEIPINEENKGFKMLQKMGYKPGSTIGRDPAQGGIKEPIKIEIKQSRSGLGKERHDEDKYKEALGAHADPEEFRQRKQADTKRRETAADLKKAQFACQNLDQETGVNTPVCRWYWQKQKIKKKAQVDRSSEAPGLEDNDDEEYDSDSASLPVYKKPRNAISDEEVASSESDDDDNDDEVPNEEKLNSIYDYLRTKYFYCLWCGARYDEASEMDSGCPGTSKDDH